MGNLLGAPGGALLEIRFYIERTLVRDASYDFLKRLLSAPGPSGYEEAAAKVWREEAEKVADATAFSLCMDNAMPIVVFNLLKDGNIARAVAGEKIGTLVTT